MSTNQIDRFISAMFKKEAEQLLFGTGTPVRIKTGGEEKVILEQQVRTDQIDKLVLPILAPADQGRFQQEGDGDFTYDSPNGPVTVKSRRKGDKLVVAIRPAGAAEPAAEAPPAAKPAAAPPKPSPVTPSGTYRYQIDKILTELVQRGGSDLHISTNHVPKYRKDGSMTTLPGWENHILKSDEVRDWMFEPAHEKAKDDFNKTNDADFAHEVPGVARFRMNIFRDRHGVGAVIRQIPSKVLTADQLGLPASVRKFCELPKGLVCVTGPTGSGKSTTLAAMIDLINKTRDDHIITMEDPVEFVHDSQKCLINQREVHIHTTSFARALKAALREDPDICLVGEMRDLETIHLAIETSETGHLVFGTLHTNTAASTVDRIIDQFPTDRQAQIRVMLSESLRGVVAQTLCKKVGGGRVAILEILICNNAVSNLIREGKTFQIASIMQTNKGIGMQTQIDAMIDLIGKGIISPFEAWSKAVDQPTTKASIEKMGWKYDEKGAVSK